MGRGKKSLASNLVYKAMKIVEEKTGADALEMFEKAVKNTTPLVEVRLVELAALPIKCRWKYAPIAGRLWLCAGLFAFLAPEEVGQWPINSLQS
jgi:hypothetical protein